MINRIKIYFAVLVCATTKLLGQSPEEALANLMPYLSDSLSKVLEEKTEFSANVALQLFDRSQPAPVSLSLRLSSDDRKLRWDLDLSQFEPAPPESKVRMKEIGLDRMIFISRLDKNVIYVLFPKVGSCLETQIPASVSQEADSKISGAAMKRTSLGIEVVEGKSCNKFRVVDDKQKEPQDEAILWYAKDSEAFPIQAQLIDGNSSLTMRFSNVSLARPDSNLFEVPTGFMVHTNFQQTLEFASQRLKEKTEASPK